MVDGDRMGPDVQLIRARFSNYLLRQLSRHFKVPRVSIVHEIQMATFR